MGAGVGLLYVYVAGALPAAGGSSIQGGSSMQSGQWGAGDSTGNVHTRSQDCYSAFLATLVYHHTATLQHETPKARHVHHAC